MALRKMEATCSAAGDPLAGTEVNDASWNICGREKSNTNLSLTGWTRFQEQTSSNKSETARLEGMSTSSNPVVTSMYYRAVLGKPFFGKPATQDLSSACQKLHMCQAETTAKQNQKNTGMEGF